MFGVNKDQGKPGSGNSESGYLKRKINSALSLGDSKI
jgi:hypothetical protein